MFLGLSYEFVTMKQIINVHWYNCNEYKDRVKYCIHIYIYIYIYIHIHLDMFICKLFHFLSYIQILYMIYKCAHFHLCV